MTGRSARSAFLPLALLWLAVHAVLEQGRADDSEEAIRHRQEVYQRETEPVVAMYRDRGVLIEVDGLGDIEEVTERIFARLAEHGIGSPEAAEA